MTNFLRVFFLLMFCYTPLLFYFQNLKASFCTGVEGWVCLIVWVRGMFIMMDVLGRRPSGSYDPSDCQSVRRSPHRPPFPLQGLLFLVSIHVFCLKQERKAILPTPRQRT